MGGSSASGEQENVEEDSDDAFNMTFSHNASTLETKLKTNTFLLKNIFFIFFICKKCKCQKFCNVQKNIDKARRKLEARRRRHRRMREQCEMVKDSPPEERNLFFLQKHFLQRVKIKFAIQNVQTVFVFNMILLFSKIQLFSNCRFCPGVVPSDEEVIQELASLKYFEGHAGTSILFFRTFCIYFFILLLMSKIILALILFLKILYKVGVRCYQSRSCRIQHGVFRKSVFVNCGEKLKMAMLPRNFHFFAKKYFFSLMLFEKN